MDWIANKLGLVRDGLNFADRGLGPFLDLTIRLWLAGIFWTSGILKASNWPVALELSRSEYPVSWMDPVTAAYLGVSIELVCPVLIAFGLLTRVAAIPLAVLALVIQFNYVALPEHLFWAILFGLLFVRGAGALSLDHVFGRAIFQSALPLSRVTKTVVEGLTRYIGPFYQLFIRLWMAEIFWRSGLSKIASWDSTVFLFKYEYNVPLIPPELAAYLSTAVELSCPVLLAFGLGSRLAAVPMIMMALVIQFTYLDKAEHFFWMMLLAYIVLRGPGVLSLDFLVERFLRRRWPQLEGKPAFTLENLPRIVIVGAGFGGLAAAKALRWCKARVTVIDQHNYHLFQPLLYQVATASLSPGDIAIPVRSVLREQFNTRVLLERVTGVNAESKEVRLENRSIPYDYLILATGARHNYFGKDEWEANAPGLKKIDDATAIRRRILTAFERAESCEDTEERRRLLTFVIVGAGPTGVELAGAIIEFARFGMAKDFRSFDPATARVILVQSRSRILPSFPETLSAKAKAGLESLGVEIRVDSRVEHVDNEGVVIGGERIDARTVLWAAGVSASPAAEWLRAEADRAGRVTVGPDLSVPGLDNVFAIGDTALAVDANGKPVPGLASAAKQAGGYVASVIRARIASRPIPKPFRYVHLGSLATIGRKAAVADLGYLRISGVIAWWIWGAVHVALLVGARNRVSVMMDWFWAYLTFRRSIRLITGDLSEPPPSAPFRAP